MILLDTSEAIIEVQVIENLPQERMLEPGNSDSEIGRDIMVAKPISIVYEQVPVLQMFNINFSSVKLKKVKKNSKMAAKHINLSFRRTPYILKYLLLK